MADEDFAVFIKGKQRARSLALTLGPILILLGGSLFFIARDPDFSLAANLALAGLVGGSMIGFSIWWIRHELRDVTRDEDMTALRERADEIVWIVPSGDSIATSFEMRFTDRSSHTLTVDTRDQADAVAAFLKLCPTARIGYNPEWYPAYAEDPESLRVSPGQGLSINRERPTKDGAGAQNTANRYAK